MERVNPKISSTCRASKQYSSFRGAVSPLTLGGGRSPFRINVPRSAREVSRFLVHETQTERKEEEERKGDVSQYKTTIFWNYEREPGCAWGGGGGHGEREEEREREKGQWKGAWTEARVREKEGENGITEYEYARFFEGGSLESYIIYWVSCYNYFE